MAKGMTHKKETKKPKKPKLTRKDTTSEELFGNLPPSWDICFFEDIARLDRICSWFIYSFYYNNWRIW
jgi:hypothetical protein